MKNIVAPTIKFVANHKVAIAVVATTVVCIALNKTALKQHDNFLKEHGLFDEYYALED